MCERQAIHSFTPYFTNIIRLVMTNKILIVGVLGHRQAELNNSPDNDSCRIIYLFVLVIIYMTYIQEFCYVLLGSK